MKTVGLLGQPNSGKTSLFNLLTGSSQEVGNWPGVTVEKKEGKSRIHQEIYKVIDLPGVYSLDPFTMDEKITRDFLLKNNEITIVNVVDTNHLERQLFLTFQAFMLGNPIILALNMMDEVQHKGYRVNTAKLSQLLKIPVVGIVAREGVGLKDLSELIVSAEHHSPSSHGDLFDHPAFETISPLIEQIRLSIPENSKEHSSLFAVYNFLTNADLLDKEDVCLSDEQKKKIRSAIQEWESSHHQNCREAIYQQIYAWAKELESLVFEKKDLGKKSHSLNEKLGHLENWILHPFFGVISFLLMMFFLFQLIYLSGNLLKGGFEIVFSWIDLLISKIQHPLMESFLSKALLQGVGNIFLLLPYIFSTFFFLSWLEDFGYLSRAAFIMDRFMHKLGLHGKSFIPLILGFGCNVPAVMSCRSLESKEEKIKTMMMISFIPCSGRLPVLLALCGLLFQKTAAIWMFFLYLLGIVVSILTALILDRTILHTPSGELIMELPAYRWPYLKNSIKTAFSKSKQFIQKAGSLIFFVSIIIWFLSYFPNPDNFGGNTSLLGWIGNWLSVLFKPLGFDWKLTVSLLTGFIAKELILSTITILFNQSGSQLSGLLSHFPQVTLFSFLVFQLLYTPCIATVVAIRNESRSWKWAFLTIFWNIAVAWIIAWLVRLAGRFF